MICQGCGKELQEEMEFCPFCGEHQKTTPIKPTNIVVIPCPHCGSTDIVKRKEPSILGGLFALILSPICLIIRFMSGSTGLWTLGAIGAFVVAVFVFINF
nr:hypothetical protein [Lachnospiraceae bacterium]